MSNTNYFGRICRFLGRIGLFASFILCIGVGTLLTINPSIPKSNISTSENQAATANGSAGISHSFFSSLGQNRILSWLISAAIISAAIIAIAYLAKKYNATIRDFIAKVAKRTKTSIHMLELGFTLIVWSALIIMLLLSFPYAATVFMFLFIINELLFLFGWISYGMPEYEV